MTLLTVHKSNTTHYISCILAYANGGPTWVFC